MRKLSFAGVAACAVAIGSQIAAAQTGTCSINSTAAIPAPCAVTSTHSLTIPSLLTLNMSGFTGPGTAMTLNAPTAMADYTSSTIQMPTTGPTYTVSANRNWKVQISAVAGSFTGPYAKPASDLAWSSTVAGSYVGLTTTPVDMTSGGPTTASAAAGVFYKTTYNIAADVPGSYSLDVKFTLVAP
jgi:hypothetical protein